MTELEQMEHMNVQLEADLKRTKEKLQEAEHTKKALQERVADLEAQNRELKEVVDCVIAEKEAITKDFSEKIGYLQKHTDELQSKLKMLESEVDLYKNGYGDAKKSFDILYEGSKTVNQQLNNEKQKNKELTNIITDLTKTVLSLSDIIE